MNQDFRVGPMICPGLAFLAGVLMYWAPLMVISTTEFIPLSLEITISNIGIPSTLWFWASAVGILMVVGAVLADSESIKGYTAIGGVLMLVFPVRAFWQILTGEFDPVSVSPGWGLFAVITLSVAVIYLSPRIDTKR